MKTLVLEINFTDTCRLLELTNKGLNEVATCFVFSQAIEVLKPYHEDRILIDAAYVNQAAFLNLEYGYNVTYVTPKDFDELLFGKTKRDTGLIPTKKKADYDEQYFSKFPEKRGAYLAIKNKRKQKGNHQHHWSYKPEHWRDTLELPIDLHKQVHKYIVYDQERRQYRRHDNNVLMASKRAHLNYINELIETKKVTNDPTNL